MRSVLSLDGLWQARLDPRGVGVSEDWWRREATFDRQLPVPLAWQAADPELLRYTGTVWYRRTFRVPEGWRGQTISVRFGAVDYDARVWANDAELGAHAGGYMPFEFDLTPHLAWDTDNTLVLCATDPHNMDELPHGKQGAPWYTRVSGPWQPITLRARPPQRIQRVWCMPDAASASMSVRLDCGLGDDESGTKLLDVSLFQPDLEQSVAQARAAVTSAAPSAFVHLHIPRPRFWSPEVPALYTLRATLRTSNGEPVDLIDEQVGLRSFEARAGRLFLNGKPFSMRGALDQGYWPATLYTPPADAEIEREIQLAKQTGLNLLRKHIKPEDPRYLAVCDRLGMLVWAEPANPTVFTATARAALRRDLLAMVERDFNRPSVVIWSLYNEDWGLPGVWSDGECQRWLKALYTELKSIDPTRVVCDNSGWAHVATDLNDYHEYFSLPERSDQFRRRLDFLLSQPEDNYAQGCAPRRDEPVLISEWGNWALADPETMRARLGGSDPSWFVRATGDVAADDGIETIAGYEQRFVSSGLAEVFPTVQDLIEHVQCRAFRSLKAQIEQMRLRPEIQGWVVTELSDIEWEANGWLDYWRQPKLFTRDLASLLSDVAVIATPQQPTAWAGEQVHVDVWLSNWRAEPVQGIVHWHLEGTPLSGDVAASVGGYVAAAQVATIGFIAPGDRPLNARLQLEVRAGDDTLASTYVELAFAPRPAGVVSEVLTNGYQLDRLFRQHLERQGYRVPRDFRPDLSLAITSTFDARMRRFVEQGGHVLWLADAESAGAGLAEVRFRRLAAGESWHMAAGAAWAKADRLAPAPVQPTLGWEAATWFPNLTVDAGCLQPGDEQLAGWFEGWLAHAGAFAVRRRVGQGRVLIVTFRLAEAFGVEPVATLLLNRLVDIVREA
jgi:hypothetical protein